MESDGDHFLAYYLPKEDDTALQFKVKRETNEDVRRHETLLVITEIPFDDTNVQC